MSISPNGVLEGEVLKAPPGPTEYADTTYYIYDGINCVAELDGDYNLQNKYIYGNGLLLGRIDSKGEFYFYGHDGLGSIVSLYDSKGTMRNYYIYDAYGNFLYKHEEVPNHYLYTGQEKDGNPSYFYNLHNRYYYASIGRFTQEDPVMQIFESPQLNNKYVYVGNNPVNYIDITGLYGIVGPPSSLSWCYKLKICLQDASNTYNRSRNWCVNDLNNCLKVMELNWFLI